MILLYFTELRGSLLTSKNKQGICNLKKDGIIIIKKTFIKGYFNTRWNTYKQSRYILVKQLICKMLLLLVKQILKLLCAWLFFYSGEFLVLIKTLLPVVLSIFQHAICMKYHCMSCILIWYFINNINITFTNNW